MKSLQLSDEDGSFDGADSQAIVSGTEDEISDTQGSVQDPQGNPDATALQFVMPNIIIPRRRPFTERGKYIGPLKIMVAGPHALGKTSLLKSLVQGCEDIVHIDPVETHEPLFPQRSSNDLPGSTAASKAVEYLASTRSYPSWMADSDRTTRFLRSQRPTDDTVLERNICFIDTPGFDARSLPDQHSELILQYIEKQLHRNASIASLSDSQLLSIFSGGGGMQVDVVLYLMPGEPPLDPLKASN